MRRLSGVYSYGSFGWGDDHDECDDDGDDGDGDDKDDGDGNGYYRRSERMKRMFGYPGRNRFGLPMRSRHVPPYVMRVTIPGTGELVSIIFKSDDDDDTEKGFEAVYRVSQGEVYLPIPGFYISLSIPPSLCSFLNFSFQRIDVCLENLNNFS